MKKTYISPVVQVVKIQTCSMMALSLSNEEAIVSEGKVDLDTKYSGDWGDIWGNGSDSDYDN